MDYIATPLSYRRDDTSIALVRKEEERTAAIDRLVELIVFTPRGSFAADTDFGFEYWNYEYANVSSRDFNNGQPAKVGASPYSEVTKSMCSESIRKSLARYEPQLKQVEVSVELNPVDGPGMPEGAYGSERRSNRRRSKWQVSVSVTGMLDDGLGTVRPYRTGVSFLMEPTAKRTGI